MQTKILQDMINSQCASTQSENLRETLEKNPIDVNYNQGTPLILAIRSIQTYPPPSEKNCLATIEILVNKGADIHINEDSPLYWALKVENHAAIKYLVSKNEDFCADVDLIEEYLDKNKVDDSIRNRLSEIKESSMRISLPI